VVPREDRSTYGVEPAPREQASLLAVLRRRALIVVVTTLLCGGAAAAFAYSSRDTYESTAKLLFHQSIPTGLTQLGFLPQAGDFDNLAQDNVQVVDSRRVAVATAAAMRARGVNMSADDVDDDVGVSAEKDTDVVDVVASASSAERAALLANEYARTAVRQVQDRQRVLTERILAELRAQLDALPRRGRAGRRARPRRARLQRNIERLRTLARAGTGSPEIIQPGYVPTSKSGSPVQTIVLGSLFGLMLGVGLALLREQSDRRLRRAEQVAAVFDAQTVTTVPRSRALKRHRPFKDLPPNVAEAFRMLQMNLRFSGSEPVRSVVVTSSRTRDGKTTVAWNLAAAAASAGLSVVLVEADMRRPSLAERYGLQPEPGLADALLGKVPVSESLQQVENQLANPSLNGRHMGRMNVLVAGHPPTDPWALMQSSEMGELLEELTRDHDLTVVDTPPIPHVADAISLLRRVDGVIVTASVNATRGPEAERLRQQLETLDARVLGVVANGGSARDGYAYAPPAPAARGSRLG
jgi:succinoglycan biosynthesis transport protein ExoP